MTSSERIGIWTIVTVPYPYTDRPTRQRRPALVIANTGKDVPLIWVLMITSAENRGWEGDVAISDLRATGLPAASVVRAEKIATVDAGDLAPLGVLPELDRAAVGARLRSVLAAALQQTH